MSYDLGWIISGAFLVMGLLDTTVVAAASADPEISKTTVALLSTLFGGLGLEIVRGIIARWKAKGEHEDKDQSTLRKDLLTDHQTLREELRLVLRILPSNSRSFLPIFA